MERRSSGFRSIPLKDSKTWLCLIDLALDIDASQRAVWRVADEIPSFVVPEYVDVATPELNHIIVPFCPRYRVYKPLLSISSSSDSTDVLEPALSGLCTSESADVLGAYVLGATVSSLEINSASSKSALSVPFDSVIDDMFDA